MAVGVGTSDCSEFKQLVDYDPWVVPHQLLPAMAVLIGIEWREVVIIMYVWESLEVIFLNCLKVSDGEHTANSLISDPVQCFVGIAWALWIMWITGADVITKKYYRAYLWGIFFIIPGVPIIVGDEYVWIYLPLFLIWLFVINKFDGMRFKVLLYMSIQTILLSVFIFALRDYFNSFYTGIITAFVTAIIATLLEFRR